MRSRFSGVLAEVFFEEAPNVLHSVVARAVVQLVRV